MDKNIAFLAFSFVVAPFLLIACDGTVDPVIPADDTTVIENDQTADDTTVVEDDTKNNDPIDPEVLVKDLVSSQPAFFKNSDVKYTGVKKLDSESIMAPYRDEMVEIYTGSADGDDEDWETVKSLFIWKEVGEIVAGQYEGHKMLVADMLCDGMCMYPSIYRFAYDADTSSLVALSAISGEVDPGEFADPLLDNEDESTVMSGVVLPDDITLPDGIHVISKSMDDAAFQLPGLVQNVLFTDLNVGKVYGDLDGLGCFYVLKPDGTIAKYEFDPGFFDDENLAIEWDDGSEKTNIMNNYGYAHYGCGIQGNCYTVENADISNFEAVGETTDGMKIYVAKNPVEGADTVEDDSMTPQQIQLAQYYNMYVNYSSYAAEGGEPISFDEYVAERPILYWQDPMGRISSIIHRDFQPEAECGKPVVYLYPEETMDVSVKVLIDEFTKTVPDHGADGWFVNSTPDSEIYNYADGQTYPYLFWEGHKKGGLNVDQGFVVSRDELAEFLPDALAKMGLNDFETADFVEFWYPIMTSNSEDYYFISFAGTSDFNKVAPLEISPAPDTLIRVFMYYNPVSRPFAVQAQDLRSIPRNGFTVVEWGGTSSRPWINQE